MATAREALSRAQRLATRGLPQAASEELTEAREAITEAATTAQRIRRRSRRRRRTGLHLDQVKPGAEVWVQGIPMAAEVLGTPDRRGEVDVSFGGLRARVGVGQIVRVEGQANKPAVRVQMPAAPIAASEIEVRGQTLEQALPLVEKFLDDGFRAGVPHLRVVHGKGTGKMRQAVREMLAKHPLVNHFEFAAPNDGGEGVTVIEMARG